MINMVLASMELTKKRSTLTFELFQRSQSKWNRALKNPIFFFTKISWDVYFFWNVDRLLRIAHGSPMKAFHCLNITRLICKRCTDDWFNYYDLIFINKLYERHTYCFCWTPYNAWTSNTALSSTKNDIFREVKLIFMATWRSVYNARATFI